MSKRSVPKQKTKANSRVRPRNLKLDSDDSIVFSFQRLSKNEYFNLDATCENWSNDLFDIMKTVSGLSKRAIIAGNYSGRNTTLRIHDHRDASPPCPLPNDIDLEEFYQIRISQSKGGIHGIFVDNVFYVVWFDPHHNMYPDERFGGLKLIKPPTTCCKDRDERIAELIDELTVYRELYNS